MKINNKNKAFTLIEILIVIGILAVLAAIVLVAINPARQFRQANDSQRSSNVNAILNAIGQYTVDNKGIIPSEITTTATEIGSGSGKINICAKLVPTFIPALPFDPTTGSYTDCSNYSLGYKVSKDDATNRVTVSAVGEEPAGHIISVTR